jgi:enediyne biosynthesis protein E4
MFTWTRPEGYNNDGLLDVFAIAWNNANDLLYRNNGDGTFNRMTAADVGNIVLDQSASQPPAWADYDNDGWPDVFVGVDTVGAVGTASNRSALGAKIRVLATYAGKTRWQLREIGSTESWKGPNLIAHFGLGDATNVTTDRDR